MSNINFFFYEEIIKIKSYIEKNKKIAWNKINKAWLDCNMARNIFFSLPFLFCFHIIIKTPLTIYITSSFFSLHFFLCTNDFLEFMNYYCVAYFFFFSLFLSRNNSFRYIYNSLCADIFFLLDFFVQFTVYIHIYREEQKADDFVYDWMQILSLICQLFIFLIL